LKWEIQRIEERIARKIVTVVILLTCVMEVSYLKTAKDIYCHPSEFSRNIQAHVTQKNIVILLVNEQREKLSPS
jgi:hypothetical protein